MTELSPAAQAVLDALYMDELNGPQQLMARAHAAAALRAAVDQVLPLDDDPEFFPGNCCERVLKQEQQETRDALLGIANALKAQ
jgi:hypothetical protein